MPREKSGWVVSESLRLSVIKYEFISLNNYSVDGEPCPNPEDQEQLVLDFWRRWNNIEAGSFSPHVFSLDFEGVRTIDHSTIDRCFTYFLRALHGDTRGCYAYFDNVPSRDQSKVDILWLLDAVLDRTNLVAIAQKQGKKNPRLIGSKEKIYRYSPLWEALQKETGWISAGPFVANVTRQRGNVLNDLHLDGIAIKDSLDQPYFHRVTA